MDMMNFKISMYMKLGLSEAEAAALFNFITVLGGAPIASWIYATGTQHMLL